MTLGKGRCYYDNFNWTPLGNVYSHWNDEAIPNRPKKGDEIYEAPWVEKGSTNFGYKIHTHLNKKFRMRMVEINRADYTNLCQYQWELADGVYLSGTGMRHHNSSNKPNYGLWYISLLIRTKKVPSELVWGSLEKFLEHMGTADDEIKPLRVYLRVAGNIADEEELKHLELMKYRKSKITEKQLEEKWSKYAYRSKLQVPHVWGAKEYYWVIKKEFYKRPDPKNRDWDDDCPKRYLLDEQKIL